MRLLCWLGLHDNHQLGKSEAVALARELDLPRAVVIKLQRACDTRAKVCRRCGDSHFFAEQKDRR